MYVTDLRHFLGMPDDAPAPARRLAAHLARVVEAATSGPVGEPWVSTVRCTRRPGRKPCPGTIGVVRLDAPSSIEWWCPNCADEGVISGWEGSPFDQRRGNLRVVGDAAHRRPAELAGRWRIVEMELWDDESVDLLGPAFIEFGPDNSGSFGFLAVEGWMDVRRGLVDDRPGVEFSWEGADDGHPASGRGRAHLGEDGSLRGRIFIHLGDESGFRAVRGPAPNE